MKKILSGLLVIGVIGAVAIGLSNAFFSDTETSKDNTFTAGELDLEIDNESYLNGILQDGGENPDLTWDLDNLTNRLFFNFDDIKPDDFGEDTISLHAENDYWLCMDMEVTKDDDNTCTEPENLDDPTCTETDPDDDDGELGNTLNFAWWIDDGDNVFEDDETAFLGIDPASSVLNSSVTLADSSINLFDTSGPLLGTETYYIGKSWCFGDMSASPVDDERGTSGDPSDDDNGPNTPGNAADTLVVTPEDGGFTCDGTALNNAAQTDILMGDISFSAFQARNNPGFLCEGGETPTPTPTSTSTPTPTPTPPIACAADVMLVLDRSGSINSTELGQLKTAAKDFVDSMGLSLATIHAGKSSFATTGSLNHHLTDDAVSLKAAIDAMVSGGFTNLKDGIDLAAGELTNPGDGHDRAEPGSPDKMIVITDGHPNRPFPSGTADDVAAASADAARLAGSEIFVVGVGSDVNAAFLSGEIADDASHYYSVSDYSGLQTVLQELDVCD